MNDKGMSVRKTRDLTRRNLLLGSAALGSALAAPRIATAQAAYPSRPVRVLVPYAAGGGADTVSRILFN
jgi:tripartite-type tricarboxylate transporter receptor subunit TctC